MVVVASEENSCVSCSHQDVCRVRREYNRFLSNLHDTVLDMLGGTPRYTDVVEVKQQGAPTITFRAIGICDAFDRR